LVDRIWQENSVAASGEGRPFEATAVAGMAFAEILKLSPQTDTQRLLKARAIEVGNDLTQNAIAALCTVGQLDPVTVSRGAGVLACHYFLKLQLVLSA
jgi:hypothetical protein